MVSYELSISAGNIDKKYFFLRSEEDRFDSEGILEKQGMTDANLIFSMFHILDTTNIHKINY